MIRMAEPLAWEVDVEPVFAGRQLRLVAGEIVVPYAPASAEAARTHVGDASPADAVASTRRQGPPGSEAVGSVAAYVVTLRSGSECCWCGGTLVSEGYTQLRLVCRSCGAEVEGPESVHEGAGRL